MSGLADLSLGAFVEAVAADHPAPGAGAAAAVCLALAAACARKAFLISARHHGGDASLGDAAERAHAIARAALEGAQDDATQFAALLHAHHHDEGSAQALRLQGKALLDLAAELRGLVQRHHGSIDAEMTGDAVAAIALSEAFERVQRRNLAELSRPV